MTELPTLSDLAVQARTRLAAINAQRQTWFKETLPLLEALTLSFAYEACRQLVHHRPQDWQALLNTPYGRWLSDLLSREGLLRPDAGEWAIAPDADLPAAEDLWQTLLRDSPASLPHLALIGHVGRQLPTLLSGEIDGRELMAELRQSPVAEVLHDDDPAYLGLRLVVEGFLRHLGNGWPASRRLRILEIAAGPSEFPKALIDSLSEDQFDYVLALPDEAMMRQQTEYQDHPNIVVATFDALDWKLLTDRRLPDAFDIVILRHTLHHANNPHAPWRKPGAGLRRVACCCWPNAIPTGA